ncbi:MAG TPA: long-chain-fatty-acid--CoA ligase [Roseiflexaceae bacterium]|jgi:fatty-acyl-CoA synthase
MLLHSYLDYWAREQPDAEFAVQHGRQTTYGQALDATNRLANAFLAAGLQLGDRIAILAKNRVEYVLTYLAASKAGVVPVPLNYRLSPPQWAAILADAQPRLLIAEQEFIDAIDTVRRELHSVERFVTLDAASQPGWVGYGPWVAEQSEAAPALPIDPEADLYQMYTSGTTGLPKGAVLTHRSVSANIAQISLAHRGAPGERSLVVLPLFHAAAVPTTFSPLSCGGALFILEQFEPAEVVHTLSEERIGFATLVPAMIQACLLGVPDVAERRYEQLRTIYYGASPISEPTLARAMQVFPCGFIQSYGMTEATQAVAFLQPADHQRAVSGQPQLLLSAGRPAVGTEVRIVDRDGRRLPNGALGEIVVRGPQLMKGYWNRPDETAAALRDGWLHTGDAGMLDDAGYLYVQDRIKDMIVSGGENVYPSVVENVLSQHPAVAEAAVIGVPDERWGETVKAIVVLRAGAAATAEELIAFCRGKLAGFERPRSVDFVDALPRTPTGKVLKRVLREPYWSNQSRRVAGA